MPSIEVFFGVSNCEATGREIPARLGCVCKTWRNISLSTPRLWSLIVLDADKHNLRREYPQVENQLRRSGQTPLSVRIFAGEGNGQCFEDPSYHNLIRLLNDQSSRWLVIDICVPGSHWSLFTGRSQSTYILRVLRLDETTSCDHKNIFRIMNTVPRPETAFISSVSDNQARKTMEKNKLPPRVKAPAVPMDWP